MTLEQFEIEVTSACATSPIVAGVSTLGVGVTWISLRAYLTDGSFVDAFHNQASGKTAFALIKANQRIFGADNTGGWHWHPREQPDSHALTSAPVTFMEFLAQIEMLFNT
jgi:hypothetical protein